MQYWTYNLLRKITKLESIRHLSKSVDMAGRIAVCQMTSVGDKVANLDVVTKLVSDAAKDNVQMIFFPEACDYICDNKKDIVNFAEPLLGGNTMGKYRQLAAEHNVWLSMGGVHEKDESDPSKMYNTHVIINNKGDIVQTYRKLHLFDVEIPEKGVRLKESDFSHAGGHIVAPVETPVGRVGMSICYDMRFPELSTALSILRAEILTFPSAFTQTTGEAHWHVLLRSRAIENQCYVIAAAQVGQHNPKRRSYGHALCVDPWGEVLADCGDSAPCYKVAEISPKKLLDVRRNMPVFQHRSSHLRIPESCVFYKSKLSYAFVNLRCVTSGHVLVAPIRMAERNKDLTDEEAEDFYKTIRLVQKLVEKVHNTQSCTITIQDGPDAGQTVQHLHCHIMPRKKGDFIENDLIYLELAKHDQFKSGHPSKPARSLEERQAEAKSLREEVQKMIEEGRLLSR
ncbi:nitrilase and fragile histidine triad fusion protein NitFhit [Manduca sexta]|uniref:nitrilase and fragile histidine triad fusion protein NitFhit n=1 Tax=Manduca sexta TaxID=7130 RepID=UPI00188E3019|nr:nitrilase and fragile histidine triad fusion protein NitFhit [Manduca sexta]